MGNTLLERNKDLEETIKHQQGVIEDQVQEIEVMRDTADRAEYLLIRVGKWTH